MGAASQNDMPVRLRSNPAGVGRKDVHGTVGEVGHSADAERQVESDGHQGQDGAVDQRVDHGPKNIDQCSIFRPISKMHLTAACGVAGRLNLLILYCMLRGLGDRRLACGRDLLFLRWFCAIQKWWISVQAKAAAISQPQA